MQERLEHTMSPTQWQAVVDDHLLGLGEPEDVADAAHPTRGDAATPMVIVPPPSASRDTCRGHAGSAPRHSSRQLVENSARADAVSAPWAQNWLAPSTDADTCTLPGSATLRLQ